MINYGFLKPRIEPKNYVLGASPLVQNILQPDGQWTEYLPEFEPQLKQFETYNCTSFNTLNCIEVLLKRQNRLDNNFSDRFVGIKAGTYPPGNDPHTVAEAIRHAGVIIEPLLPFTEEIDSIQAYYSYKGGNEPLCTQKGLEWTETWDFGHEYVPVNTKALMEGLKLSPLGISVFAWQKNGDKFYKRPEQQDNHWTMLVGYKEGEYWIVDDSYLQDGTPIKHLEWDYPFGYAKRFHLSLRPEIKKKLNLMERLLKILSAYIKEIFK